jgi:hypothetical protein
MLRTEILLVAEWYDYESIRELKVYCDCERSIPNEALERLVLQDYQCPCGHIITLAELDKYADSLIRCIPK